MSLITFDLRMIHIGKITRTGSVTAENEKEAWNTVHPPIGGDPLAQCMRCEDVLWVEVMEKCKEPTT